MLYLFVLGRDGELSKIEVESLLETKGINYKITDFNKNCLVIDCENINPKIINELGGIIKIAKVISSSNRYDQIEENLEKGELYTGVNNKIEYSIDAFNTDLDSLVQDYFRKRSQLWRSSH